MRVFFPLFRKTINEPILYAVTLTCFYISPLLCWYFLACLYLYLFLFFKQYRKCSVPSMGGVSPTVHHQLGQASGWNTVWIGQESRTQPVTPGHSLWSRGNSVSISVHRGIPLCGEVLSLHNRRVYRVRQTARVHHKIQPTPYWTKQKRHLGVGLSFLILSSRVNQHKLKNDKNLC